VRVKEMGGAALRAAVFIPMPGEPGTLARLNLEELRAQLALQGLTLIPTADLEDLRKQVADATGHAVEDWRCG
jgi:hypothetical protein